MRLHRYTQSYKVRSAPSPRHALADSVVRPVAVATFTTVITLVREIMKNDHRVELLVYAMCDMMECFKA
jgi:hypothetical protein